MLWAALSENWKVLHKASHLIQILSEWPLLELSVRYFIYRCMAENYRTRMSRMWSCQCNLLINILAFSCYILNQTENGVPTFSKKRMHFCGLEKRYAYSCSSGTFTSSFLYLEHALFAQMTVKQATSEHKETAALFTFKY